MSDDDNAEVMADDPDCEVKCPHCGATWHDVYEYFADTNMTEVETECIACRKQIIIRADYEVTYYTRKGKA